jgi:hypothetical protein
MKRFIVVLAAVAICTVLAAGASAEANLALRGIGLKAGVVNPEDVDATLGAALIADLGTLHPNVALESYTGFWSQTENVYGGELGVRDFSFGANAKYMFTTSNPSLKPFLGGGLGLHIVTARAETDPVYFGGSLLYPGYSADDTEVKVGLDLAGGLNIDQGGTFSFLGEGRYTIISDVAHFSMMFGAVYMFGR